VGSDKGPAWLIPGGAFFWLFFCFFVAGMGEQKIFAHDAARLIVRKIISVPPCLRPSQTDVCQKTSKFAAAGAEA
jgi:hypothetical protein